MAVGDVFSDLVVVKDSTITWTSSTSYSLQDVVTPTAGATWWVYECTTAGTSGTVEPSWPTVVGSTVTDNSVVWTCRARYLDIQPGPGTQAVIHNIYHEDDVDFAFVDGTSNLIFDSVSGPGAYTKFAFHVTNTRWIRVRNLSGTEVLIGYDGIVTKSA